MKWLTNNNKFKYWALGHYKNYALLKKSIFIRTFSTINDALTVHEVSIKSCGSLYKKWKEIGKFPTVPNTDLIFKINYYDTCKNSNLAVNKTPTVVALHGAPGTCNDFSSLTAYLHERGVRVIAPSFPDFSTFRPGIFRHSDEEKAQYVKDFLSALSVSQVDLLVCHSSAVYPGLLLCLDQKPVVKSIALLNSGTFTVKIPALWGYGGLKIMVKASESLIFLKLMDIICPIIMKIARVPVRTDKFLDPLLSATVMAHANIIQSKEKYLQLSSTGFPMFYAFSENDKLIGGKNAYDLAYLLGAKPEDICLIDKNGNVKREGKETPTSKFMAFENGSHYVFWKYADKINEEIFNFLTKQIDRISH